MKGFFKWLGKVVGTALVLCLVIVFLPRISRFVARYLPDGSQNAVTVSAVLSRHMEESARLETNVVSDTGVISSSVDALLIGQVQNVVIQYSYEASLGIDLKKVEMVIHGNTLTLKLPPLEVMQDSLTVTNVEKDDFWFPLTEGRRQQLIDDERLKCRAHYLEENEENTKARETTVKVVNEMVNSLLNETGGMGVQIECIPYQAQN